MKILFMCVANSARSQLAEGMAKILFGSKAQILSAGSQPAKVNPFAARALSEVGFDASSLYSKAVSDLPKDIVDSLDYVITLCAEEVCPVILSKAQKIHWPLPDPAGRPGTDEEQMAVFRSTRDEIRRRLEEFGRDKARNLNLFMDPS
ncbi:MAG TPA: arsenate reductase ArsC [Oligoflexus sp.]|uniref:arsenate reductase ArsC n=1 Tax=Oligoflexus sp. TaxID=1971216 RepID=UPI002D59D03A|nr:arsenate reductase ArsC [Oligoflexus sp.]HYX33421.1 arsenate reductase ArsC [Oligoflexus sp.]